MFFCIIMILMHHMNIVGLYQSLCITEFPKTTFVSPIVIFIVPLRPTIIQFLKANEHFIDICSQFSLWWPFSNRLAF
jgi:hypothetical protein